MKRYIKGAYWEGLSERGIDLNTQLSWDFPNSKLRIEDNGNELLLRGTLYLFDMAYLLYRENFISSKEFDIIAFCVTAKEVVSEGWDKISLNTEYKGKLISYIDSIIWDVEDGYDTEHPEFSNKQIEDTLDKFLDLTYTRLDWYAEEVAEANEM